MRQLYNQETADELSKLPSYWPIEKQISAATGHWKQEAERGLGEAAPLSHSFWRLGRGTLQCRPGYMQHIQFEVYVLKGVKKSLSHVLADHVGQAAREDTVHQSIYFELISGMLSGMFTGTIPSQKL